MAGVVEQGGERFKAGDEVFGETVTGYSWRNGGAFAEYVAVPERLLAEKPATLSFEQAAAATVTVDGPAKLDLLRELGADHVLDHTTTDFTREGERYDVVVDIAGNHAFPACRRALTADGTYVLIGHDHYGSAGRHWLGSLPRVLALVARAPFTKQLPAVDFSPPDKPAAMAELIEAGTLEPALDRIFPLDQARDALRYLTTGQARGKVVLSVR